MSDWFDRPYSSWVIIARQAMTVFGLMWNPTPNAPLHFSDARMLVWRGLGYTAQVRGPDGRFVLLWKGSK